MRRAPAARAWTLARLVRYGERRFRAARLAFGHGTASARDEAAWLALFGLGLPRDLPCGRRRVPERAAARVLALFDERIRTRKPAAYLTREAWLGGLRFYVDERAAVPRSHIAEWLERGLAPWIARPDRVRRVLDLGTGSGCLAVLAARAFPRARVDAVDASRAALSVARINRARYRLVRRIRLVESDWFSALAGKRYDLIVCNPPYVAAARAARLAPEYRHEPRIALAGGASGLALVRRIVRESPRHLVPGGSLVVEVGSARRRVERMFPRVPFVWLHTAGGGDVFLVRREDLPHPGH